MGNARHVHGPVTTAKDGRFADGGLLAVQGPTAIDTRTGVLVGPGSTALVTGTAATAPMTVAVAPHHWVTTRGAANGPYLGALELATTVTIPAAPAAGTGTRIDVVYSKQQDAQPGIPTPDGTTAPLYGVVSGVAGGAKPALPVGAEELATVAVSPGATATNGANVVITNTARQTVARGADIPVSSKTERDALTKYVGLSVKRLDDGGRVERYTGNIWASGSDVPALADIAARNTYFTGNLRAGASALVAGNLHVYDGATWRFTLWGVVDASTDANGVITFAHNAGQGASFVHLTLVNSGNAANDLRAKLYVQSLIDPTTISVGVARTDTSAPFANNRLVFYWQAKF